SIRRLMSCWRSTSTVLEVRLTACSARRSASCASMLVRILLLPSVGDSVGGKGRPHAWDEREAAPSARPAARALGGSVGKLLGVRRTISLAWRTPSPSSSYCQRRRRAVERAAVTGRNRGMTGNLVVLFKGHSQYGSLNTMVDQLAAAFRRCGVQ